MSLLCLKKKKTNKQTSKSSQSPSGWSKFLNTFTTIWFLCHHISCVPVIFSVFNVFSAPPPPSLITVLSTWNTTSPSHSLFSPLGSTSGVISSRSESAGPPMDLLSTQALFPSKSISWCSEPFMSPWISTNLMNESSLFFVSHCSWEVYHRKFCPFHNKNSNGISDFFHYSQKIRCNLVILSDKIQLQLIKWNLYSNILIHVYLHS